MVFVTYLKDINCAGCGKLFHPKEAKRKFCSIKCNYANRPLKGKTVGCLQCGKSFYKGPNQTLKFCSSKCYWADMKVREPWNKGKQLPSLRGEKNPFWVKGDNVKYTTIHKWLFREYGKASKCEICGTTESKRYEWAKLKGKEYERKRENFWELCKSCHTIYDDVANRAWIKRRAHGLA